MVIMSFQPLIVVILLIYLVIMALVIFLWFLISPGAVTSKIVKPKPKAKVKTNPALRERAEPVRQTAPIQPKKEKKSEEPMAKQNKEPNLKYVEIRPKTSNSKRMGKKAIPKPKPESKKSSIESRNNFRGLNASKVEKTKKLDPFDSFAEASKNQD